MACLLILHRRFLHVEVILSRVSAMGIRRIHFALDGPRSQEERLLQSDFLLTLDELCERHEVSYTLSSLAENRGIFVNMVTALDWFFEENAFGLILEDDTIPELELGNFISSVGHVLAQCSETLMISGWRNRESPGPSQVSYEFSSFPLIWGWATSQEKWKVMRTWFFEGPARNPSLCLRFTPSFGYWRTGYNRAISGQLDSWAIVLAYNFLIGQFKSIVPQTALVRNVGLDEFATNSRLLQNNRGNRDVFMLNSNLDQSLTNEIFHISYRHIFAPIYGPILDLLLRRSKRLPPAQILKSANKLGVHGRALRELL